VIQQISQIGDFIPTRPKRIFADV